MDFETCKKELDKNCFPCDLEEFDACVKHTVEVGIEKNDILDVRFCQCGRFYIMMYFMRSFHDMDPKKTKRKLKTVPKLTECFRIGHICIDGENNQASYFLNNFFMPVLRAKEVE